MRSCLISVVVAAGALLVACASSDEADVDGEVPGAEERRPGDGEPLPGESRGETDPSDVAVDGGAGHDVGDGGEDGGGDASTSDASPPSDAGLGDASLPDAGPTGPTAAECLEGWASKAGACPAPVITASYVASGCVGHTGWFIEGQNFQLERRNVGIADYGPRSIGVNGNQRHWNVITPTLLCVTVSAASKGTWVGATIHVENPDGKTSNSVVVTDKL